MGFTLIKNGAESTSLNVSNPENGAFFRFRCSKEFDDTTIANFLL